MKPKLILGLALVLSGGLFGCSATHKDLTGLPFHYQNTQYDLTFSLPAGWQGYAVLIQEWKASLYATNNPSGTVVGTERGPIIVLRHPQWRTNDQYQDIEIMVFTQQQWKEECAGGFFPYAGGVIGEMWHNEKCVFGLYDRYNWGELKGMKEVSDLVATNCAGHPGPHLYPEP
jgi:hypothetical protein